MSVQKWVSGHFFLCRVWGRSGRVSQVRRFAPARIVPHPRPRPRARAGGPAKWKSTQCGRIATLNPDRLN
ncbi:hypothetical protein C7S13_7984 [Burkholderia cepacia]|nr:hypothetical protein [Burkholderia cepacia]